VTDVASSPQPASDVDSPPMVLMNWQPKCIGAAKSFARYWIVENTKVCSEFCKVQMKVGVLLMQSNGRIRLRASNGHLRRRKQLNIGMNIMKSFTLPSSLRMFFANIAKK
jgi:hypothetical protein